MSNKTHKSIEGNNGRKWSK